MARIVVLDDRQADGADAFADIEQGERLGRQAQIVLPAALKPVGRPGAEAREAGCGGVELSALWLAFPLGGMAAVVILAVAMA